MEVLALALMLYFDDYAYKQFYRRSVVGTGTAAITVGFNEFFHVQDRVRSIVFHNQHC
jgi:hypothetical protein